MAHLESSGKLLTSRNELSTYATEQQEQIFVVINLKIKNHFSFLQSDQFEKDWEEEDKKHKI